MKKYAALLLVLVTALCFFAGCGSSGSDEIVLPAQNVEETLENRQKALLEVAWAYWRKNPYIQYDSQKLTATGSKNLGVRNADGMSSTPEMAGPQRTVYHVCSFYTSSCSFHTFNDYKELGGWAYHGIAPMSTRDPQIAEYTVFQASLNDMSDAEKQAQMEQFRGMLLPGDMIYYIRNKTSGNAHTVIWLGDYDGDGDEDMINVDGSYYDAEAMEDIREADGGVDVNTDRWNCPSGEQFFFDPTAYDYFPKLQHVSIIRYADEKHAQTLPLTERAKTRFLFPGLDIFYEVENGIYGAVPQGGELTYTLRLKNNSQQDHKGLLVQLPVPENAEIVKVNGNAAKNKTVKLNVDIPAGQETNLTYTVKATGEAGSVIRSGVGYVHAIPLPSLNTTITAAAVDAEAVKAAVEENKSLSGEAFLAAYLKSTNAAVGDITVDGVQAALFDRKSFGDYKVYWQKAEADVAEEHKALFKMQITDFFGGQSVGTVIESLRVKELRAQDLMAGDILLWKQDKFSDPMVAVHNGEALLVPMGGRFVEMSQYDLDRFLMYDFFLALRPAAVK